MSYIKKRIKTTITLANGGGTIVVDGLGTEAKIRKLGLPDLSEADIVINNLGLSTMEQLTFLAFKNLGQARNIIEVEAGNEGENLSLVFGGEIDKAFPDFNAAPNIPFNIHAMTGGYASITPSSPISSNGEVKGVDLAKQIANEMGYDFESHGNSATLNNFVANGDSITKLRNIRKATGDDIIIDDRKIKYIGKKDDGTEATIRDQIPKFSKNSGLIGYPTFTETGVNVNVFFCPTVQIGGMFEVDTIVPRAGGQWRARAITHEISAYTSTAGRWQTTIDGVYLGYSKEQPILTETAPQEPYKGKFDVNQLKCKHCGQLHYDARLVSGLEDLQNRIGRKLRINCGYRCPVHNAQVGGASRSYHMKGMAADVSVTGMSGASIASYARQVGVFNNGGIGTYSRFCHCDVRGHKARWMG